MALFPIAWGVAAYLAARGATQLHAHFPALPSVPWLAAWSTLALAIGGGFVALRYAELSRDALRSLRVRFTRRRYQESVARLRQERAQLTDAVVELSRDVPLPR
jgi:hypothetical protein